MIKWKPYILSIVYHIHCIGIVRFRIINTWIDYHGLAYPPKKSLYEKSEWVKNKTFLIPDIHTVFPNVFFYHSTYHTFVMWYMEWSLLNVRWYILLFCDICIKLITLLEFNNLLFVAEINIWMYCEHHINTICVWWLTEKVQ